MRRIARGFLDLVIVAILGTALVRAWWERNVDDYA